MIETISTRDLSLMTKLPEDLDTNDTYHLVGPNGEDWTLVYDTVEDRGWTFLAF